MRHDASVSPKVKTMEAYLTAHCTDLEQISIDASGQQVLL
jgi:hypothetical protein